MSTEHLGHALSVALACTRSCSASDGLGEVAEQHHGMQPLAPWPRSLSTKSGQEPTLTENSPKTSGGAHII